MYYQNAYSSFCFTVISDMVKSIRIMKISSSSSVCIRIFYQLLLFFIIFNLHPSTFLLYSVCLLHTGSTYRVYLSYRPYNILTQFLLLALRKPQFFYFASHYAAKVLYLQLALLTVVLQCENRSLIKIICICTRGKVLLLRICE